MALVLLQELTTPLAQATKEKSSPFFGLNLEQQRVPFRQHPVFFFFWDGGGELFLPQPVLRSRRQPREYLMQAVSGCRLAEDENHSKNEIGGREAAVMYMHVTTVSQDIMLHHVQYMYCHSSQAKSIVHP